MIIERTCAAVSPLSAILTCMRIHSSVTPSSRCSSDSPTQRIGVMPASSAACSFLLTVWSVSAKYSRRSLWPMTTYCTPISRSISALTSPVKAPLGSKCMFCAPTRMLVPLVAAIATRRSTYGTQITTSQFASFTSGLISSIREQACEGVLFIFQFPAITVRLKVLFMMNLLFLIYR